MYEDVYPLWSDGHRCCTESYSALDGKDRTQLYHAWEAEFRALYKK